MPTNNIILMITPSWGRSVVLTGWHFKEYIKVLKGKKIAENMQEDVKQMVQRFKYL